MKGVFYEAKKWQAGIKIFPGLVLAALASVFCGGIEAADVYSWTGLNSALTINSSSITVTNNPSPFPDNPDIITANSHINLTGKKSQITGVSSVSGKHFILDGGHTNVLYGYRLFYVSGTSTTTVTFKNFDFQNAYVSVGSGAVINAARNRNAVISFDSSRFIQNTADFGGAAGLASGALNFYGQTSFTSNTARIGGGAVSASGKNSSLYFDSAFFGNNKSINSHGGAICLKNAASAVFEGFAGFSNNVAGNYGGAFYLSSSSNTLVFNEGSSAVFKENEAGFNGVAIFMTGTKAFAGFYGSASFENNKATGTISSGGAMTLTSSAAASFYGGVSFTSNSATVNGGAVYND